jgi:hypothetical protein
MMRPEYGYASKDCRVPPPQGGPRDAEYIFDMHLINWVSQCALHDWPAPPCRPGSAQVACKPASAQLRGPCKVPRFAWEQQPVAGMTLSTIGSHSGQFGGLPWDLCCNAPDLQVGRRFMMTEYINH